ncbi:MAG: hypothetical protein IKU19_06945 [Clostridia bacterium]|nr:hypothetical protein [Clostridia bacterium]
MSYCVNCGVELAEYIKKCPLCSTEVINPNQPYDFTSEPPYPEYNPVPKQKISPRLILGLIAVIFMLPTALCLVADLYYDGIFGWSGYVIAVLFAIYTVIASALVVHRESVFLEQIFDYMAITLLLVYIEEQSGGGWFLSFALPMICAFALTSLIMTFLIKVLNKRVLTVISIGAFGVGVICVIADLLIKYSFYNYISIGWSLYPFISLVIIGSVLLFIDNNKYIKRRLEKKFFI